MSKSNTLYSLIGGEANLRNLVGQFYKKMDEDKRFETIRQLHAKSLKTAESKLFDFLSGWLGGPSLYIEKYGHPRLRQRHLPFSIGELERDQWLLCMGESIKESGLEEILDEDIYQSLLASFYKTADFMRNQE